MAKFITLDGAGAGPVRVNLDQVCFISAYDEGTVLHLAVASGSKDGVRELAKLYVTNKFDAVAMLLPG